MSARRLAVVPARFGSGVVGGAEAALIEMGQGLASRGWEVDVLTTCARDHFTWENVFPAGRTEQDGLVVHRFPAVVDTPGRERARLEAIIQSGGSISTEDQQRWMNDGLRVPALFHHLVTSGDRYRAVVFAPYPFWPAYACSMAVAERAVLMPCLHDEPYAYLPLFQPVFRGVAGLLFLTQPEKDLAERIAAPLAPNALVGSGVRVPADYDVEGFRTRHGLRRPYLLYAGRREGGKNWERLLEMFAAACSRQALPFDLVTMGVGEVRPPRSIADRVVDLGYLDEAERDDAFAGAAAYLQPSAVESFSRTAMESWLAGVPVVANGASAVLRWHVERSGAGLLFDDEPEFEQCLAFLAAEPDAASAIGAKGRRYVLENYTWDTVLDQVEAALDDFLPAGASTVPA